MKSMALFNNKGGVGKTTLTFHLAHMFARLGIRTVTLDYDPQANLTAVFLSEDQLEELWRQESAGPTTVARALERLRRGKGEVERPELIRVADHLDLLPGDLSLSRFEQNLAEEWAKKSDSSNERALDVTFALDLLSNMAADVVDADLLLVDLGPSLGALNRAALLACDHVVVPLAPDLFSLQGLENVGPTLREWRADIAGVRERSMKGREQAALPPHSFEPLGYVVQQHLARVDRPVSGYRRWADQVPSTYAEHVLESDAPAPLSYADDPHCIATLKHMASLAPLAQLARKPMFDLKQADGIGGGQVQAVARCRDDFEALAEELLRRLKIDRPCE
jgi:cellulose biosynthesis protein BcsQ